MEKTIENTEQTGVATDTDWDTMDWRSELGIVVKSDVELMCVKCGKRWIEEIDSNTQLKNIQCGLCGLTGFVINTGQQL